MNICMLCPEMGESAGNAFIGGHTNNVLQLSKALHNRGHNITILTTPHRHPGSIPGKDVLSEFAEVITLPIWGSFSSIEYGLEFAYKAIRKINEIRESVDIIHGHSGYSMLALITGISAKRANLPSIHTIYCPIGSTRDCAVNFFSSSIISKFYFKDIDLIIAITENIRTSLIDSGISKERIMKVPIGINKSLYNPLVTGHEIRNKYKIDPNQPVLMYVGNLTKHKGLPVLILALNEIRKEFPNVRLFMVLNMPLDRFKEPGKLDKDMDSIIYIKDKIQQYGLEDSIIPLGLLQNIYQFIAACDVFITPFFDTVGIADYPTSLLEAMAIGKPVIATKVGGIPEIIFNRSNGLLIEPNDTTELINAIKDLLTDRQKANEMGNQAAKLINTEFNIEAKAIEFEALYAKVMSNHSCNRRR
jgi:glycosyltransferase involved in cell wall biosynthesis